MKNICKNKTQTNLNLEGLNNRNLSVISIECYEKNNESKTINARLKNSITTKNSGRYIKFQNKMIQENASILVPNSERNLNLFNKIPKTLSVVDFSTLPEITLPSFKSYKDTLEAKLMKSLSIILLTNFLDTKNPALSANNDAQRRLNMILLSLDSNFIF